MKKKVCGQCNLEFEADLEKCPVCGKSLFEQAVEVEFAAFIPKPESEKEE